MASLYLVFAFDCAKSSLEFTETLAFDLAVGKKMIAIDWAVWTIEAVKEEIFELFEGEYMYFTLCEISIEEICTLEIENKKLSAG
jgi:hypothetical protein